MRVSCLQENLSKGLNLVSRAVAPRSTLPVLANVLLATDNGRLRLAATNLEMGITAWIGAQVEEDGAITVPARTLGDLVNTLPPERIDMDLTVRTQTLHLACGSTTSNIKGIDAHDFPLIPEPGEEDDVLSIPVDLLRDMIHTVAFAAARDDSRPALTGILLEFQDGMFTMAAADGFRLSVREVPLETDFYETFALVVPARTLSELARVSAEEEQMAHLILPRDRSQVLFHMTNVDMVSQLIEGNFPDYRQIIPKREGTKTRTIVDTAQLLRACKRADIFAREAANTIRFNIEPQDGMAGVLTVSATAAEMGDNQGVLAATIEGEPMEIAFNVRYMIEVLSVIQQDRIVLETSSESSPGVLQAVGDESFTHVIMPMHIGR